MKMSIESLLGYETYNDYLRRFTVRRKNREIQD